MRGLLLAALTVGQVACSRPADAAPAPAPAPADHAPQLYPPAQKAVGVGQTVHFSTAAIDQDMDETATTVTKLPASASFDAITQTITWTPTRADQPKATFEVTAKQPGKAAKTFVWTFDVPDHPVAAPVAASQDAVVEELLLIHDPARLAEVNKQWPIGRLLEVGAKGFPAQFVPERRKLLKKSLGAAEAYTQFLTALAETHGNPRLDPASPQFDKAAFGDPRDWKIVAFRPRIDKQWAELRVVYQAVKAGEPVFAMFRLRPVVEYVPALPRPPAELTANNKLFLGMVAKRLMADGGPSAKLAADPVAHGKAVAALMTDVMTFDDTKTAPYLHGFMIGIAIEGRMGGGTRRDASGAYVSGDGWAWSAQKPFQTPDGAGQRYQNVSIPGFWTKTVPSEDQSTWVPMCGKKFNPADPAHDPGYEVLCRKTMGFVDLPGMHGSRPYQAFIDANNLYPEYKRDWMRADGFALEDGRRDLGEENGMTCAQCHIRDFGMHDYGDPANTDPKAGVPKHVNHALPTLNFIIIPQTGWEPFTLEFVQHQECRGKVALTAYLGADAAKGLTCPLAK